MLAERCDHDGLAPPAVVLRRGLHRRRLRLRRQPGRVQRQARAKHLPQGGENWCD